MDREKGDRAVAGGHQRAEDHGGKDLSGHGKKATQGDSPSGDGKGREVVDKQGQGIVGGTRSCNLNEVEILSMLENLLEGPSIAVVGSEVRGMDMGRWSEGLIQGHGKKATHSCELLCPCNGMIMINNRVLATI